MTIKITTLTKAAGFFALLLTLSISAQQSQEIEPQFSPMPAEVPVQANKDGVAIDGFDPVAYFDDGKAVKGVAVHSCEYLNRTWHFSSAENRDKFLSDPEKFSPQYGGYCAHSLSKNKIVESDPESFLVRDEKLYLYTNDSVARKDTKIDKSKFSFNKSVRDKNWLTYQSDF